MSKLNGNLRHLAGNELYFSEIGGNVEYKMLTNTLIIHSKIDFTKEKSVVYKALLEWRAMHPFLNTSVEYEDEARTKAHFKRIEEKYNFENILFLSLSNEEKEFQENLDSSDDKFILKLLIEREANIQIDVTAGILWRFVFFKFQHTKTEDGRFKYAIIFSVKHTVSDLKNQFDNLYGECFLI
jgi:hypothetical protein